MAYAGLQQHLLIIHATVSRQMNDTVKPEPQKSDGVDVRRATTEQLATYDASQKQIDAFHVPQLYNQNDPDSRVFVALFDGTGNDAIHDPEHITNVGLLKDQLESAARTNPNIGVFYKEGPGTQGGLRGVIDGATGGTYQQRLEVMYREFNMQSEAWLRENPNAKISVVSVGFSRGAEQAAGFTRLVDERGVQDPTGVRVEKFLIGEDKISFTKPPLQAPGQIAQAVALYDPVATGEPERNDRRPANSVLSGLQIKAGNEYRKLFPADNIIPQGLSEDKRFLGVTTAGCHSDIGGGYKLNGLSTRNFNLMSGYLNATLGSNMVQKLEVPTAPEMSVIHDSSQHKFFYLKSEVRGTTAKQDPQGLAVEPVDPKIAEQFRDTMKPIAPVKPDAAQILLRGDDTPSNRLTAKTPEPVKPDAPKL